MPPSRHSSSSHSSSSHSSSSHSSSHSSSRSSSSHSSRPTGHTYTTHRSGGVYLGKPSSHSSSSYYTGIRQLRNQPKGYNPSMHNNRKPECYYGTQHDYMYYPESWVDTDTNTEYQAGYYDENGEYYKAISFREDDGTYHNVLCQCDYCGTQSMLDVTDPETPLLCPCCNGKVRLITALDEHAVILDKRGVESVITPAQQEATRKVLFKIGKFLLIFYMVPIVIFFLIRFVIFILTLFSAFDTEPTKKYTDDRLYLDLIDTNTYEVMDSDNTSGYDKLLIYDSESDLYYDSDTDCYVYFNQDIQPYAWQYWYEDISSNYGDYGWMEYDDDELQWYIEYSNGNWEELSYAPSYLWHIKRGPLICTDYGCY